MIERYKWTVTGFVLALIVWTYIAWQDIDAFEYVADLMNQFEHYELNDLVLPILLFYTFLMADLFRRHERLRVQAEKLSVYRKMMKAVNHIMNNFLQKMLAFRLAAENTTGFDPKALDLYNQIISEADEQIQALGSLEQPEEELIEQVISHPNNDAMSGS